MLTDFHIQGFRGIKELDFRNLAKINILVGKNGIGKTSLLEAISIAANPEAPQLLDTLGRWRDLPPANSESDDALRSILPNLDPEASVELRFTINTKNYTLGITPKFYSNQETTKTEFSATLAQEIAEEKNSESLTGIIYKLTISNGYKSEADLTLRQNGHEVTRRLLMQVSERSSPSIGSFFIQARRANSASETTDILTKLFERKEELPFIEALKKVDKRIARVVSGVRNKQPIVLVDIGIKRLMPISLLGDGFCRICLILTGLVSRKSKILIVDEIDSGLHTSVMDDFWRNLIAISKMSDVQIFCTTHSEEMLQRAVDAFESDKELLRVHRIERKNTGDLFIQTYTYDLLEASSQANIDVR